VFVIRVILPATLEGIKWVNAIVARADAAHGRLI
jgi:hypothetical protein